jgi:hypothetical protein
MRVAGSRMSATSGEVDYGPARRLRLRISFFSTLFLFRRFCSRDEAQASYHHIDQSKETRLQIGRHHQYVVGNKFAGRAEVSGEARIGRQNAECHVYVSLVVIFVLIEAAEVREPGIGARTTQGHDVDKWRVGDLTEKELKAGSDVPAHLEWNVAHQVVNVVRCLEPDILGDFVRQRESGEAREFGLVGGEILAINRAEHCGDSLDDREGVSAALSVLSLCDNYFAEFQV